MQKVDRQIAFVCTGNTCRSPMAEAIFNKLAEEKELPVRASSFGMAAANGVPASALSVKACEEIGVDLTGKKANFIYNFDLNQFEKYYCMSAEHANMLMQFCGVPEELISVMNIPDPFGGNLDAYRACREEIVQAVEKIIKDYEN